LAWKRIYNPSDQDIRTLRDEYQGKVRFLVDESAGPEVAELLKQLGHNAKFAAEVGLIGHSDEDVFAVAWRDKRVIVTHDSDFLDDRRFPPHRNPGVIVVRPGSDGHNSRGLFRCLFIAIQIAGRLAGWFRAKKLDFASEDEFSIKSPGVRQRYRWLAYGNPMIWED
jgi:predicted nuclease of predicted toxin-antitoxin system